MNNEFFKYATKHVGLNTLGLEQYISKINNSGYISPTVIEERQLNVAQMDVFSRLMIGLIPVDAENSLSFISKKHILAYRQFRYKRKFLMYDNYSLFLTVVQSPEPAHFTVVHDVAGI